MITTSYNELVSSAENLLKFTTKNSRMNRQLQDSWIQTAIRLVEGLFAVLDDEIAKRNYLAKNNKNAECLLSLVYLHELHFIYKHVIEPCTIDEKHLINRVKKILNAPLLTSQENFNTNEGRNYLLELLFFAELLAYNFKANLGEFNKNPDIEVKVNSHTYAVECKRIFSENSFISNFKEAEDQLNKSLDKYNFGIPVIDVSRVFVIKENENFLLKSSIEQEANNKALDTLEKFFNKFRTQLYRNCNSKIPALILHLSTPVVLEDQKPFLAWGHYLSFCELSDQSQISIFHLIKSDFSRLAQLLIV